MNTAIVIPTKDRSEFLIRQLTYYAEVGCNHTIFIADSSDNQRMESTHKSLSRFEGRIEVKHLQFPGLKEDEAIQEISQRLEQPYVVLASDDDFLIPGAIQDCADFLDSHSEYSSVHGLALSFAVGLDKVRGEFVRTRGYPQQAAESSNGRLRLLEFLASYWPAHRCVQRGETFRNAAALASKSEDRDFRGLLASCVSIIRGKSKHLDRLYSLRQTHIQYSPLPYGFDWVTDPNWFASYTVFRSCLEKELAAQDGVGNDEAAEVVKEAFRSHMAQRLARGRAAPLKSAIPPPRRLWRQAAGAVPGMKRLARLGRVIADINPPSPDKLSLSVLLRPSSPYHADFMPVYRVVTTPVD